MISIKNLTKVYNRSNIVFRDFGYNIDSNLFLLIGPNGSGKTTLINCITNYIRYRGNINFEGNISYLPGLRSFDDDVITKDLIKLFSRFYDTNLDKYIEYFGLKPYLKTKINDLSKGNKTRLFILCTLSKPANIYIFDEPTDGLDTSGKEKFINFCSDLSKSKLVIISTHDMGIIDKLRNASQILDLGVTKKC